MSTVYPAIKSMSPQFVVADLEHSLDFYTRELGFAIEFRYEDFYAGINRKGYSIHLKSGDPHTEYRAHQHKNENLDLMFSVENIQSLFDAIRERSVAVIQPLREMPYGREFYIADPDGYILGFIQTDRP